MQISRRDVFIFAFFLPVFTEVSFTYQGIVHIWRGIVHLTRISYGWNTWRPRLYPYSQSCHNRFSWYPLNSRLIIELFNCDKDSLVSDYDKRLNTIIKDRRNQMSRNSYYSNLEKFVVKMRAYIKKLDDRSRWNVNELPCSFAKEWQ